MSQNMLTADDFFALSNYYFELNIKIQNELIDEDIVFPDDVRENLIKQAVDAGNTAVDFQQLSNNQMTRDVGTSVAKINNAIVDAIQTIREVKIAGKVIEIIADLVDIAVTIGMGASKPTAYAALPALVKELRKDLEDLKNQ
ncbi:hypothetical protein LLY42_20585 [Pseudomonas frederiksbergensis]|nr:hypothetical protein LLY42_20585 [Pseudomonas frederiksbergensis]